MKYRLSGYNIDNLLKILYTKKVVLYNVERLSHNEVSFEINDKQAKKVKRYITNFKTTQNLTGFKRLPSFILANLGIVLGVFFGSIFYLFASQFTWQIKVYGTKELSEIQILDVLSDNNIKKGKINLSSKEEIEEILLKNYDRIAQVSVIKQGTAIIINLSEKLVYQESEHLPIRALNNGIITEINIITGTTNVKVGDYVNIGDILVLPFNLDANNNKISVEPIAEIKAEIYIVGKCEISKTEQVLVKTGKKQVEYKYKFFNLNLFSGKNKNSFALFESFVYNENVGNLLPFTRDVCTYYELAYTTKTNNFEECKQNLIDKSIRQAKENLVVGEILSEETITTIVEDKMYAITTIKVNGIIND